jgi:hypothetical protein
MSGRRARTVLPLLLVVLTLGLCEGLLQVAFRIAPPENTHLLPDSIARLHIFEPADGSSFYGVKPNYRQRLVSHEFSVEVRTNNIGLREQADYHGEPVDIAFVGDSFTFGWGVEVGERYSDLVAAALPDKRVLSYAYPNGHSPINYLAFLQAHPEMMPQVLVLGLFAFNDLASDTADAIIERDPDTGQVLRVGSDRYAVDGRGFIHERGNPLPEAASWRGLSRRTAIGRTLRVAWHRVNSAAAVPERPVRLAGIDRGAFDETARTALAHIEELNSLASSRNAVLMVFYIPFASEVGDYPVCRYAADTCVRQRQQNLLGDALRDWAREQGIRLLDPVPRFRKLETAGQRLYFPLDAHWTPLGHAAAAELILDALVRRAAPIQLARTVAGSGHGP